MARTVLAEKLKDDLGKTIPGFEDLTGPVYVVLIELTEWHEKNRERPRCYLAIGMDGKILRQTKHNRPLPAGTSHAFFTS